MFADIGLEKVEHFIDELIEGGCDHITFLTDYDTIVSQGKGEKFNQLVKRYEDFKEVLICDSMPSIEIWFLLHFTYTTQEFVDYESIKRVLRGSLPGYDKTKKYLENEGWFENMVCDKGFQRAQENANRLLKQLSEGNVGKHFPFTKMPLAIEEFEKQKGD